MSDLDFRETTKAIRARGKPAAEKSLSISLDPGGFVTELASYGRMRAPQADTSTLQGVLT